MRDVIIDMVAKKGASNSGPYEITTFNKDSRTPGFNFKINFNVDNNGKLQTTGARNEYIVRPGVPGNSTILR